jgi:hypothetical protein
MTVGNFYNPFSKNPDWSQGIQGMISQIMSMYGAGMFDKKKGAAAEPGNVSPMDNGAIGGIATPELPSELGLPKPMGMAGSPPKMPPTGGNMAGQPLDIGALKGKITPEEIQMIMQIFQAKKMMGTKGFGGI